MLSPKANQHSSNLSNCETDIPDQQQHNHRHPTVNGNSHLRTHNEQKFQQSQSQQHLSSNINRRGSSSNALPPHMTTLSSSGGSVTNSALRRKSSSCYQQQLLGSNAINCSTDTLNDCNNDASLTRYSPHPNDLYLQHQLYHHHRKPSLQPIERFEDSLACCLPPPSPAPNSDRFIEGTCVIIPPSSGGTGQAETQNASQNHQQQTISSSTSNSSMSTGVGSSSSSSTSAFQPAPSHHSLKYSANQSINAMQRSISPSTTRFRINNDRYRDINSANSSPSVNTAPGSSSVVLPSSTRFVNLSSHFPYQNCTTPSLVSTDTYSYLTSTVHTPVKRYVPTPPPPNQLYVSDQHHVHHQMNMQTPTQIPANSSATTTKNSSSMNTSSGSSVGTSTSAAIPYRVHTIKCCAPDQVNDQQASLNLNQANEFYSSSPRLRNSYNCSKIAPKDPSMTVNFNESQPAQPPLSKNSNMMASQNCSTTQKHMIATIMGCGNGNGGVTSPPTNLNSSVGSRSQMPTYTSRNGLCSLLNDLQEPLNSTIQNMNDVSQPNTCTNALRSEDISNSAGISIGSGTSSTCLHCKTVRRTTGVHQTTQTTGPISPVPQMAPLITTNNNNTANQGFGNERMTNITMTLAPTPTETSNHLTPPTTSMSPSNRLLYKKLDISPDQMFPNQLKSNINNNQIIQAHISETNQPQSSNLEHFLPTARSLNQQILPSNQPISQPPNNSLQQQQQQQQRYSCKKRFTQYMRREVLRFFGIEQSTEAEDYGVWQGRQRRLAIRRFGSLKTESELQAELSDVCANDNTSGSMPRNGIHCSAFNSENQQHHYHHHHHNHQRHATERPDILPIQDTEGDDTMLSNGGGDSTGNNGVNGGNNIHVRGRCQRDQYHHPHYNVDIQVGDHVERKASVASMLVQSFSFIKHTLNKHQTSRYKRRQWSRSFAPAHVQYHMSNGGHVTRNEFYEGLSALQDDEVFFDSPPGVDTSGVMGSAPGPANTGNNGTNISNSSINSTMRVTSVERQMFISGERSQQGWRTSNIIGQNDGSLTVHQPIVVHASAEQQISHQQQHSMQQHQQQLHGIRGNRISAQLLDGVLENSQRPVAKRIKLFCANDLDDRTDHRPFFTYWINTVQIIVLFFSLLCYGIGPIGFGVEQRTGQVLVTSLSLQTVEHSEQRNVWIGPRNQDLVHMGAKFATCMRRDVKIIDVVMKTRRQERETACCIRNDDSGCVQSSQADCSVRGLFPTKSISTWKKWSPGESGPGGRISGSVCGLDPKYCDAPASIAPYEWPDDITKWPICRKTNSFSQRFRFKDHTAEHMVCEVIGHPCCTGIYGECQITTREYCDFVNGYFHEEASLCSQISCLSNVCGMFPFVNVEVPDQFYRLLTSLCMHAGILHLVITVVFQHIFLADLERLIGPIRTAILYIGTGLAGNLTSAVLVPYKPEVGPLASLSGVIASLVVLLIHAHWQQLHKPHIALFKLIVIGAVLFAIGTLPWQLNFASLFAGIFCGIFLTIALVPFVSINKYKRKSKINLIWTCIIFHIFVYTTMFIIFYMFSTELTKLSFGEVFTNSFNTGVTSGSGGGSATSSPGITTTDIMHTGISSNNINRHSFMQQQPLYHHYHHLSDDIIKNNAAAAVDVATATLAVGADGANGIENVDREGSQVVMIN